MTTVFIAAQGEVSLDQALIMLREQCRVAPAQPIFSSERVPVLAATLRHRNHG